MMYDCIWVCEREMFHIITHINVCGGRGECVCVCIHKCKYACMYVCMYVLYCIVCMYVCMYVCISRTLPSLSSWVVNTTSHLGVCMYVCM
jgi:hypothetical protein